MATNNNESNSGLWFLVGAVIIAVAGILWYLNSGSAPVAGGDTNVTVTAPAAPSTEGNATPAAPAAPAGGSTGTTTESSTTTTTTEPAKPN